MKYKFQFGFTGESYLVLGGVTGIIAFNSFGNDLRMMQMYKALHLKTATVLWSKYLGLCMLGLIQLFFVFRADVDFPGELSGLF
ncbi:hypothetical protein AAG663_17670 [Bacillus licheniformis]